MIDREEIRELAREFQLEPNVVEKDYALGWLLAGLSAHPSLAESWNFKGGTCLKKCFFETYRFSEDLDFSLLPGTPYAQETLTQQLRDLERQGLITRKVFAEVPPRVEYTITALGRSLRPVLKAMYDWGMKNQKTITSRMKESKNVVTTNP